MLDGTFPIRTLYSDVDAFDPRTALRTDLIGHDTARSHSGQNRRSQA